MWGFGSNRRSNEALELAKKMLEQHRVDAAMARTEASTLREQNKVLQVNMDWMRQRVNGLELERAALLRHTTQISMPVPEIAPAPPIDLNEMPSMEDMGDAEAARLGVAWGKDGRLEYTK